MRNACRLSFLKTSIRFAKTETSCNARKNYWNPSFRYNGARPVLYFYFLMSVVFFSANKN